MKRIKISSIHLIPLSFLAAILAGAMLLALPVSSSAGEWTAPADALFTATTSVCVTGLVVVDTYSYWSLFGQAVILVLIQIGGLGVITVVSTLMLLAHKQFSLSKRVVLRDALNLDSLAGLLNFLARVVRGTLIAEAAGACLYMTQFVPEFGLPKGIWVSVFNAVSAFCNAGIDVLGPDSLAPYRDNPLILLVTMVLIIAGGLGYVVWFDLAGKTAFGIRKGLSPSQIFRRLSEHTKLALTVTAVLIAAGTAFILAAEYGNPETLGNMPFSLKLLNSLFESVTFRTAGFATFSQKSVSDISYVIAILLMFIGGSPVGTAGGVKTTTFYLSILNITSYLRGDNGAQVFRRSVSAEQMKKAHAIVQISAATILGLTLLLIAADPMGIEDGLFEIVSACATVGLTRGATPLLNTAGKLIVTLAMYLGRIGPISMAIFLVGGRKDDPGRHYAEGNFFIG